MKRGAKRLFILSAMFLLICFPNIPAYANVQYPLSEIVDYDYDDDGVVDIDDVLYTINLYINKQYDRAVDSNYDGVIDIKDLLDTIDKYLNGFDIVAIRQAIKNNHTAELHWGDIDFSYKLQGLNPNQVESYTRGWLDVYKHLYNSDYICMDYAADYALAAYKDLGYGCLLFWGSEGHLENVFWNGKNSWQDLDNWHILNNYGQVEKFNKEGHIYFPVSHEVIGEKIFCECVWLEIDLGNGSIDYHISPSIFTNIQYNNPEEPIWIGKWDTTLGF